MTGSAPTPTQIPATGDAPVGGVPLTRIDPARRWKAIDFPELWRYREVLYFLTWRDVKVRYKQTVLGAVWAILQPLLMAVAFTFVLGRYARLPSGSLPYPLFVYAGMLTWVFFSSAITNAGSSVVNAERVVTKIYFPRLALPFAAAGASLVDLALASTVLGVLLVVYGVGLTWTVLLAPVVLALLVLLALGIGCVLSALMVAYRDVRYVLPFLIQVLLFSTPGIYMDTSAAAGRHAGLRLLDFHPLNGLIAAFRACVTGGEPPWRALGVAAVITVALFLAGCFYFRKSEDRFADII